MSKPKFDRNYARRKLELVLRDLRDYTADEFWREISRIASGATGLPSAEQLQAHAKELEAIKLGLTKTMVEMEKEKATLVEVLESIIEHYPHPDIGHERFRILACRFAEQALATYRKKGSE